MSMVFILFELWQHWPNASYFRIQYLFFLFLSFTFLLHFYPLYLNFKAPDCV
jgi:hypothetical protein